MTLHPPLATIALIIARPDRRPWPVFLRSVILKGRYHLLALGLVGIIANPAASKDIRRLVAQGRVVPDWEKVNILKRVMLGLEAVGIGRVAAMPDSSHLVQRAREDPSLTLDLELLDMPTFYSEGDTVRGAALMEDMGVDCLITLGGDGTNRAVARGSCSIPMVPISTGTNNVFPTMVEGTQAGLAAGLVARGSLPLDRATVTSKTLEIYVDGEFRDMALIDVALSRERFVASRAIWDINSVYEVFLTRAEPSSIGLSSVGARLQAIGLNDDLGLSYLVGDGVDPADGAADIEPGAGGSVTGSKWVLAPIAPGVIPRVPIASWRLMGLGERLAVERRLCTVALDGERAFTVHPHEELAIVMERNGPPVVQVDAALRLAAELGLFSS